MDIDQMRREYLHGGLTRESLKDDPIDQFQFWLQQAVDGQVLDPTAMSIATVSADGQPSQRIVLLKDCDERGFVFYTNHGSRKAQDIEGNNKVSLHFAWLELDRQVKISGTAEKVPTSEALKYFLSRPKESQLAAWASEQSHPISSRGLLEQQFARMKEKFHKGDVPLPSFWGGYRVQPHRIEFWQGGAMRLHDRFQFSLQDNQSWLIERLAP
jgi:pyridoxamine 5'-phosphate oxidase